MMTSITLAYVNLTTRHAFCHIPTYSEAPGYGVHGLAQPIQHAQLNGVEQHGLAVFGGGNIRHDGILDPNQTQHPPRLGQRGTTNRNDRWSIRPMREYHNGITDDDHSSLSDPQLRQETPATRMWQALLPQARTTLFSTDPGATTVTRYISGTTNRWFNTIFQKTKLDTSHTSLFGNALATMTSWGTHNFYVAQLATRQPLINQQVANKFKSGVFRHDSFSAGIHSVNNSSLLQELSLYTTLPAKEGASLDTATQLMLATASYASINSKQKAVHADLPAVGTLSSLIDIHASLWWMAALIMAMVEKRSDYAPVVVMMLQYMADILASPEVNRRFNPSSLLFTRQLHHILSECQRVFGEWCSAASSVQYACLPPSSMTEASHYAPALQALYQFKTNVLNLAQVNMEYQVHPLTYVPPAVTAKRPRTEAGGGGGGSRPAPTATKATTSDHNLTKAEYAAAMATGYFSIIKKTKGMFSDFRAKYPRTLCHAYAIKGIGCAHGASGEEGKLAKCKKAHTPYADLTSKQQEFVKAFAQDMSSTLKLLEE